MYSKTNQADNDLRRKIAELNMLKDYSYTPKNVVLITVEDIIELVHEIAPYSMQKLDEAHAVLSDSQAKGGK